MKKLVNTRIPAEQAAAFNPLALPTIEATKVVNVVKNRPQSSRDWRDTIKRQQQASSPVPKVAPAKSEAELAQQAELDKAKEQAALEAYTEGLEKGRQKGEQQGYQEGQAKAQKEQQALSTQVAAVLDSLHTPLANQQQEIQVAVMNVAVAIAEAVLQRELVTPSESMVQVVASALQALPSGATNVRIHMHSDDVACLQGLKLPQWQDYQLVADPQCQPGDCVVKTAQSTIDFTVSARFKQVLANMFEQYDESR